MIQPVDPGDGSTGCAVYTIPISLTLHKMGSRGIGHYKVTDI